jgi:KaiC/GvpD/RAD55 family RecA-like ATPase
MRAPPASSGGRSVLTKWRLDLADYSGKVGHDFRYDRSLMRDALFKAVLEREGKFLDAVRVQPPKGMRREEIENAIDEAIKVATKPRQGRYASEIEAEPIQWLWPERIAVRKLTIVDGDPGTGKSTLTIDLAARVSTGRHFPDGGECCLGKAILVTAEDGPADTIRPRLEAAGADLTRVVVLSPALSSSDGGILELPKDIARLEETVLRTRATMMVLDPFSAFLSGDVDSYKDQDIRKVTTILAALAERCDCAVILVRHLGKSEKSSALYRGLGSIGAIAAARSAFVVASDPTDGCDSARRVFCPTKSNLSRLPPALAFSLVADPQRQVARVDWAPEPVAITADELLAGGDRKQERGIAHAVKLLTEQLASGPKSTVEVERAAEAARIGKRTLERARFLMGIESEKMPGALNNGWFLALPACRGCETDSQSPEENRSQCRSQ